MKYRKAILFLVVNSILLFLLSYGIRKKMLAAEFGEKYLPHAYMICDSVLIESTAGELFSFIINHYPEIYPQIASVHREFSLLNTDSISEISQIHCIDEDEGCQVTHNYSISKIIQDRQICLASFPSTVLLFKNGNVQESFINCVFYMELIPSPCRETFLKFTLVIQLPSVFHEIAVRILGDKQARNDWEGHLKEELVGFRSEYYHHKLKLKF